MTEEPVARKKQQHDVRLYTELNIELANTERTVFATPSLKHVWSLRTKQEASSKNSLRVVQHNNVWQHAVQHSSSIGRQHRHEYKLEAKNMRFLKNHLSTRWCEQYSNSTVAALSSEENMIIIRKKDETQSAGICSDSFAPRVPSSLPKDESTLMYRVPLSSTSKRKLSISVPFCVHVSLGSGAPNTRQEIMVGMPTAAFVTGSGAFRKLGGSAGNRVAANSMLVTQANFHLHTQRIYDFTFRHIVLSETCISPVSKCQATLDATSCPLPQLSPKPRFHDFMHKCWARSIRKIGSACSRNRTSPSVAWPRWNGKY